MKLLTKILLLSAAGLVGAGVWLYTPDKSQAELVRRYGGPPSEFVPVAGLRLHVRDTGPRDAPVIIMLHGFGSSLHTWEPWAQALATRYRVIRYDLPGFGLTGPDPTGDYSDARGLAVLAGLMDALSVPHASLVGNSMGGKLAWLFASQYPDRVDKLVLISPDGFASPGFEYGREPEVPMVARLLPYTLPVWMLRANLAPAYADPAELTGDVVARYRDLMLGRGVRGAMVARIQQVRLERPEPLLHRIKAPTLLLWGERDALIPFDNARDYLKAIGNSRLVPFADLGHVPQEEAPARSLPPLEAFLAEKATTEQP